MTLLGISGLINLLTSVTLVILVWSRRSSDRTAIAFAQLNLSVGFYNAFYCLWQVLPSAAWAGWSFKLLCLGFMLINQTYLQFVSALLGLDNDPREKMLLRVSWAIGLIFGYFTLTGRLYTKLVPLYGYGLWPIHTGLFVVYLVIWHVQCLIGFVQLILAHVRKDERQVSFFVIGACAIGYLGGASNWPMWFGLNFPPYFNNLIAVYIGMIAYAVLHHKFMDVRLVLRDTSLHLFTMAILSVGCFVVVIPTVTISPYFAVVLAVFGMAGLMAFVYEPLRNVLRPAIDRIMFANQFAYLQELAQLPNDILEFTNLREMLRFLVTRLTAAGKLEHAAVYMYDPAHQSYLQAIQHQNADVVHRIKPIDPQWCMGQDSALANILRTENRLWMKDGILQSQSPFSAAAMHELTELGAEAFFGVTREKELVGIVVLGPKTTRHPFNQNDVKILRALKLRLENFLLQAMVTTQESLNMVKDSHDMKNDVNALSGRLSMKRFKIKTLEQTLNKKLQALVDSINSGQLDQRLMLEEISAIQASVTSTSQEQQALLPVEEDALQRLSNKLQNWSVYGRLVEGGFQGTRRMETIDISAAAKMCVERWLPSADRKKIKLDLEVGVNLYVTGERSLVEQVLDNLVDNGIKATEAGNVKLSCHRVDRQIIVKVQDTGCGIPEEHLAMIFKKPFYQGKGRESLEKSTGVGLVLVGQYVKSLNGNVRVESNDGKGTTFFVSLPAAAQTSQAA